MAEKDEKIKNINYNVYMTWGFLKVFHTLIFISISLIKTNNSSKQKISFLFFTFYLAFKSQNYWMWLVMYNTLVSLFDDGILLFFRT